MPTGSGAQAERAATELDDRDWPRLRNDPAFIRVVVASGAAPLGSRSADLLGTTFLGPLVWNRSTSPPFPRTKSRRKRIRASSREPFASNACANGTTSRPMLYSEPSRSAGIFQVIFILFRGLAVRNFVLLPPAEYRLDPDVSAGRLIRHRSSTVRLVRSGRLRLRRSEPLPPPAMRPLAE